MGFVGFWKQFFSNYYPRGHLYFAGALGIVCLTVLFFVEGEKETISLDPAARDVIPIKPPDLQAVPETKTVASNELVLEDFVATEDSSLVDEHLWRQNIDIY